MKMKANIIIILIILTTTISCKTNKEITGKYRTNFPSLGFFMTVIDLNPDQTFHFIFSGDLTHTELDGIYKINKQNLYLRFNKLKEEYNPLVFGTKENPDTILNFEDWQNSHSYDLKNEKGIDYHLKYKIGNDKLKIYHIEKGKIVHRAKWYTDRKRFILLGPNYKKKKWYLKKIE